MFSEPRKAKPLLLLKDIDYTIWVQENPKTILAKNILIRSV